ncbi:MAG: ribose-phosphate pyrophosphokinase-like domain-containing protein, partial [Planctomycetes bacterium]|nr:ribose-phosphate pyrophosphokinase-like domain-containing protein [Planctomycetota bacterium]
MTQALARHLHAEIGQLALKRFPDGETLVRFDTPVDGCEIALVCTLIHPDDKVLPLLLAAGTARDLGAKSIGLVAPYLAYLRQDQRFHRGEGITSKYFARIVSAHFDWLVTVDPHLHRYRHLGDIYAIPTEVAHSTHAIAAWIRANVDAPLIIGPDSESEQWV